MKEVAVGTVAEQVTAQPELIVVQRYRCPFCHRSRSARKATAEHIGRCWQNPAVRSCKTCTHLEPGYDACGCTDGCNWGSPSGPVPESCAAGVELGGPVRTGCPLWTPKEEA
jgi:hypothetical protein